jgi:hypothetical protein
MVDFPVHTVISTEMLNHSTAFNLVMHAFEYEHDKKKIGEIHMCKKQLS